MINEFFYNKCYIHIQNWSSQNQNLFKEYKEMLMDQSDGECHKMQRI